jgi:class 3 adenylate cyclase
MKNFLVRVVFTFLGFILFFFLLFQSTQLNFKNHSNYVSNLRQLNELDARINQTLLQLRTGTLKTYDLIVYYLNSHEDTVVNLASIPNCLREKHRKQVEKNLNIYQKVFLKKSHNIENFKTENAIIRNSLAYLPIAIANAVTESETLRDALLGNQLNQLLRDILIYNLSPSNDLLGEISQQIQRISQKEEKLGSDRSDLNIALVHSRIIVQHLPEVNRLLDEIISLPTTQQSEVLSLAYEQGYEDAIVTTNFYRLWLYLFLMVLGLGVAAYIIIRLSNLTLYLSQEQEKSERLLLNVLPQAIAERLKEFDKEVDGAIAEYFNEATILFADIVGFTPLSARMSPIELVNLLNEMFSKFDQLTENYGLEKIKTIGDAYMVAGGLPIHKPDHAASVALMALEMQQAIQQFQLDMDESFQIRIGIHTGPVIAGVIGIKKFIYDLWGDTVNLASRMESSGLPGKIQVTAETYEMLKDEYIFEQRGQIFVKGKGEMTTYWLIGKQKV